MDPPGASLPVTSTPVEPPAVLVALIYEITTLRDSPALTHFWENFNLIYSALPVSTRLPVLDALTRFFGDRALSELIFEITNILARAPRIDERTEEDVQKVLGEEGEGMDRVT